VSARERKEGEGGTDGARKTAAAERFTSAAAAQDDDAGAALLAGKEKGSGAPGLRANGADIERG
jgi:hypothetical protein